MIQAGSHFLSVHGLGQGVGGAGAPGGPGGPGGPICELTVTMVIARRVKAAVPSIFGILKFLHRISILSQVTIL